MTAANAASVNTPQSKGKRRGPFSPSRPAAEGNGSVAAQTFSRETAKTSAQGSRVDCYVRTCRCKSDGHDVRRKDVPRSEERANRFGKRPDCAISRRAIRACPGVTFRRLRRFFLRLSHGHCAPAYACPLFSRRGKQRSVQGSLQPLQPLQPPQPRQNGAPAPRAEEISGALSPAAQRQRRTRARQRPALSRRPRGRTAFFTVGLWRRLKRLRRLQRRPPSGGGLAAALRRGALRHGGAASAIWSGQAESG